MISITNLFRVMVLGAIALIMSGCIEEEGPGYHPGYGNGGGRHYGGTIEHRSYDEGRRYHGERRYHHERHYPQPLPIPREHGRYHPHNSGGNQYGGSVDGDRQQHEQQGVHPGYGTPRQGGNSGGNQYSSGIDNRQDEVKPAENTGGNQQSGTIGGGQAADNGGNQYSGPVEERAEEVKPAAKDKANSGGNQYGGTTSSAAGNPVEVKPAVEISSLENQQQSLADNRKGESKPAVKDEANSGNPEEPEQQHQSEIANPIAVSINN